MDLATKTITKAWTRNESDVLAVANGCWFDPNRAANAVWWIERYCRLYEGEWAGENVLLRSGCPAVDHQILDEWDDGGEELSVQRAHEYAKWFATGKQVDWQYECTMRMFGWVRRSQQWGRVIRRFNAASIWIPKKQKKSPTLATWGVYLTCGDGEQGAKCFGGAKDGQQALIAMQHAMAMIEQSPELSSECKINKNERSIEHIPTRSKYKPLSSANERTKVSKEGINGNILIDECFVAGTPISTPFGAIAIDKVMVGDRIHNAFGTGEVVAISSREVSEPIYHLEFSNGTAIECTGNHPIFTEQGWTQAKLLAIGTSTFSKEDLRVLRQRVLAIESQGSLHGACVQQNEVLLAGMCHETSKSKSMERAGDARNKGLRGLQPTISAMGKGIGRTTKGNARESIQKAKMLFHILQQEVEQPDAHFCLCGKGQQDAQADVPQTIGSRRKRPRIVRSATCLAGQTRLGLGIRVHCQSGDGPRKRIPNTLQTRRGRQNSQDLHRGRRSKPLCHQTQRTRRQERSVSQDVRLVGVSCVQSAGSRTVYNLQVSGHPSYFANGHLVHNCHVVDRDFIKIISRAGISRAEPFHIEVSTAGNNPDGYGKERQDYARQVVCGAEHNDQLFVAIYEAPQTLTDKELAADPIKYGMMANPAWGHTAHEEEYLADYNASKRTLSGLADFKMYRLNIWQHTSSQWLRLDQWLDCGDSSLTIDDYAGRPAACGLDLSKTRDMSALSISIPIGDKVQLFVRLWMTEAYIEANADKAAFHKWVANGELFQIPGDTIQEDFIRAEFERLTKQFDVKLIVKDRAFAADFTDWCETKFPKVLQVDYPQNAQMMEKPIDDFEAAVIEGSLIHPNNLCLNWQAGHAAVSENARGFRIIRKPKRDDYRKVDGMVAAVMSHWGTKHLPKKSSVYRRRGVLTA